MNDNIQISFFAQSLDNLGKDDIYNVSSGDVVEVEDTYQRGIIAESIFKIVQKYKPPESKENNIVMLLIFRNLISRTVDLIIRLYNNDIKDNHGRLSPTIILIENIKLVNLNDSAKEILEKIYLEKYLNIFINKTNRGEDLSNEIKVNIQERLDLELSLAKKKIYMLLLIGLGVAVLIFLTII